jgi:lambda family phage portal protein
MAEEKSVKNYSAYLKKIVMDSFRDYWDGSKFTGSLGPVSESTFVDYWTLRRRSLNLFKTNIYARGVIRRLVWNEINTGLVATPTPRASVLFPNKDALESENEAVEWGEKIAAQFDLYSSTPSVFDWGKKDTFGSFQEKVRLESLICGDGIIISRIDKETGLPRWQWVNGNHIRTPDVQNLKENHYIRHGVEFDKWGKRVAYYVQSEVNGEYSYERIPVRAERSGRLVSWMVYGSEHFIDDVRGEPFLSDSIYMLKDLDRTRDAEVRAALVNAMIPLFIEEAPQTIAIPRPSGGIGGATLASVNPAIPSIPQSQGLPPGYDVLPPTNQIDIMNPGTIYKTPTGGKITSFQTNRPNVNYSTFEKSVIATLAWSHGLPPEILMLEFQGSYSASRQANNEFEVYLKRFTQRFSEAVTRPIYDEFFDQMVLTGALSLPGFAKAMMSGDWKTIEAWKGCAWTGLSRPSVDRLKEANASVVLLDSGLTTYDIESRRHSGLGFIQTMMAIKREKDLMDRMGFTPKTMENNNGEPAYQNTAENDDENEGEQEK